MKASLRPGEESSVAPSSDPGPVTVVLIDEQELTRGGLRQILASAGIAVVGEAATAAAGIERVVDLRPDVVLLDFLFRGTATITAIERISLLAPASRILVLTDSRERDTLLEAIVAGASGYILKDAGAEAIVNAVRASWRGECVISPEVAGALLQRIRERDSRLTARNEKSADLIQAVLTERELEIFKRLASGETNKAIGRAFSLSENTVKNHVASILAKLHLHNRIQAAAQAVRTGFSCVGLLLWFQAAPVEADLPGTITSILL